MNYSPIEAPFMSTTMARTANRRCERLHSLTLLDFFVLTAYRLENASRLELSFREENVRNGSWLRDNALTQAATVHDPVNVVRHG
jgi:hypothetical protein